MNPRALLFDLDNTLLDRQAAVRAYLAGWLERSQASTDEESFLEEALLVDALGYAPREDFLAWWSRRSNGQTTADLWTDWQTHLSEHIAPDPHLKPFIETLEERFALAIVTNGGIKTQRPKLDALGLYELVDSAHVLISGALGSWKPDPQIFLIASERVGHDPGDCMFIGDDPARDIAGAHRVGMQTCWVRMNRDPEVAFAELDVWPDRIVNHYAEVLELL